MPRADLGQDRDVLLAIKGLTVVYPRRRAAPLVAVDAADLEVHRGETVAVLGESGSGKSTIGNAVLGLAPVTRGSLRLDGRPLTGRDAADRSFRTRRVQAVFQDPYGSLNPTRTIGDTLVEPLLVQRTGSRRERRAAAEAALAKVGLPPAAADRYPASFSGGQRQRIAIARAIIASPQLVICDEPVSGLDLSVQAQVLNLLTGLQQQEGVALLFISHDIAVVRRIAQRVVVLFRGRIVETGTADEVCVRPQHPYTRALALAAPVADPAEQQLRRQARREWSAPRRASDAGPAGGSAAPSAHQESTEPGCPFAARCPFRIEICTRERPALRPSPSGSLSACHRADEMELLVAARVAESTTA